MAASMWDMEGGPPPARGEKAGEANGFWPETG